MLFFSERTPTYIYILCHSSTLIRHKVHGAKVHGANMGPTWVLSALTPPCVAESDQRHAQHPLKMLGIDFSCGSYQTNNERIMLLNSWYQIDMSLYSNRYLFVRSKIGRQKWQPHILCKTMSFFASRLTPWFAWQPRAPAQKTTRADMQILYSLLSQYLCVLNNVRGRYEKCIVPGNKDFWIW